MTLFLVSLLTLAAPVVQTGSAHAPSTPPAAPTPAPAPTATPTADGWRELDRVVVIVNEDIVTSRVLLKDLAQLRRARPPANENDANRMRSEILAEKVKEKLRIQAGKNLGMDTATVEQQVDEHLRRVVERYDGVVGLSEFLQSKDLSSTEAREQVRDRLYAEVWEDFITGENAMPGGRIGRDTFVRPGQMRFIYQNALDRPDGLARIGGKPQSVVLQFLIVDPQSAGGLEAAKTLALELRQRILDGEDMSELNERYGSSKTAGSITAPLDEMRLIQIEPIIGEFVKNAKPGDLSDVMSYQADGKSFWRLMRLVDRAPATVPDLAAYDVQQQITKRAEEQLAEIRKDRAFDELLRESYVWPPEVFRR